LNQFDPGSSTKFIHVLVMKELMTHSSAVYLGLGLIAVVTAITLGLLGFIISQPGRWSDLVDKENDFWVGKGMVSAALAEKFRRFEKGPGQKILTALVSLAGVIGFIVLATAFWRHPHR
jgi:hypothetical protein